VNQAIQSTLAYVNGIPIPIAYFQALDTAQYQAVDGDAGGTWTPTSQLGISGAGLWICGPSSVSAGSLVVTTSGSGHRIVLGSNDMIGLGAGHSAATRVIRTSCGLYLDATATYVAPAQFKYGENAVTTSGTGARFFVPLRVHNGGTFASAVLTVNTAGGRAALPFSQPKMRICAVTANGFVIPLNTTTETELGGWVQFAIGSVGAYNSQTLTLTYTLDAGIVVDTALFGYVAEIVDEANANAVAGNNYTDIACTFTGIPDLGFS
jgi:hypothetical protein